MPVPFSEHRALLQLFLERRGGIVGCIERLLNAQKKPLGYQQDFALLSRQFGDCFFTVGGLPSGLSALRGQLEQAHWDSGFKPRAQPGNALVDPAEQMLRAFHMWRQTRWPGQNARVRFAHTLFNLYVVRCLALLIMRLWDENDSGAPARLTAAQDLLDALWQSSPSDQPRLVRDVRWLFPVAMSPTTDSLAGYFAVARQIANTLPEADRIETQKAWVVTGAGHLRSQLRDLAKRRNVALDDHALVLLTRVSNALDVSLLMEGLVTLLAAYAQACNRENQHQRVVLASAILQGISPDPELFIERLDLLGPYTMIEHLFIASDADGRAAYTEAGTRHRTLLTQYTQLIAAFAPALQADCVHLRPGADAWSPYGALYGFASNLLELTAFKAVQHDAPVKFSLEDVFSTGGADKLAWINGWRRLPHVRDEIVQQFDFPRQFALDIHARIEQALLRRVAGTAKSSTGRLYVATQAAQQQPALAQVGELPRRYVVSSDPQLIEAGQADAKDAADLMYCRNEGEFLVSYATRDGWAAISKDLLTDILGAGIDARIVVPPEACSVLELMCPDLVTLAPNR